MRLIQYIMLCQKKENGDSNYLDIFNYDEETKYKYMVLVACGEGVKGNYTKEHIDKKFTEIENNIANLIDYDNEIINKKINDEKKNILFEKFKKIMKEESKDKILNHIKKYKIQSGETYLNLIKKINEIIGEILSEEQEKNNFFDKKMLIEYIRLKIIDKMTKNSFTKNELIKAQSIKKIIMEFCEDKKTKNGNELFNDLFLEYYKNLQQYDEKEYLADDILNLFDNQGSDLSYLNVVHLDTDILNKIHEYYKKTKNEELKKLYNKIKEFFCVQLCYKLNKKTSIKWKSNDYIKFIKSAYGYLNHEVDKKIETEKCDSDIIKNFTKKNNKKIVKKIK